jgi:hypothetical protein
VVRGGFSEPGCGKVLTSPDRNARGERVLGSGCCQSILADHKQISIALQSLQLAARKRAALPQSKLMP